MEFSVLSRKTNADSDDLEYCAKQITDYTWVQCDNIKCQKWRKVFSEEAKGLEDKKWFCEMNSDPKYSTCSAPEEDHNAYDRLAKKLGLKYVMSSLEEGCLVWAKMTGYCSWPAVITRDPICGLIFERNADGNPCAYHVEYLGSKHTHGWIRPERISLYGHSRLHRERQINKRIARTKKTAILSFQRKRIARKNYRKVPVEEAIVEADFLLEKTKEERLKSCVYIFGVMADDKNLQVSKSTEQRVCLSLKPKQSSTDRDCFPAQENEMYEFLSCSMVGKSKEEKFKIDIEMYKRNEKSFEHDLRRFMDRNSLALSKQPVWNQVHVGYFHLFLTVYEQGGYKKVCKCRAWNSVYRELAEVPAEKSISGSTAKSYYKKNLYPYEKYITARDTQYEMNCLKQTQETDNRKNHKRSKLPEPGQTSVFNKNISEFYVDVRPEELDKMIKELECLDNFENLKGGYQQKQQELGINIKYLEEFSDGNDSSEMHTACLDFDFAHIVPDSTTCLPAQRCRSSAFSLSFSSTCADDNDHTQILCDLDLLDEEFENMEKELTQWI